MNDDRNTPLGTFHLAEAWRAAADCLDAAGLDLPMSEAPVRYAYCHAIELHLKSFLRQRGMTEAELRGLGHNVATLAARCVQEGLQLSNDDVEVIAVAKTANETIRSRYYEAGARLSMRIEKLRPVAAKIARSVHGELQRAGLPSKLMRS